MKSIASRFVAYEMGQTVMRTVDLENWQMQWNEVIKLQMAKQEAKADGEEDREASGGYFARTRHSHQDLTPIGWIRH